MNFTEKNNNRKTYFRSTQGSDRRAALSARRWRRALGGAFGNLGDFKSLKEDVGLVAYGTSGHKEKG